MEMNEFLLLSLKCYIMITDLTISLVFTTFGNKPKKFDFVHQIVSCWEVRTGWDETIQTFLTGR